MVPVLRASAAFLLLVAALFGGIRGSSESREPASRIRKLLLGDEISSSSRLLPVSWPAFFHSDGSLPESSLRIPNSPGDCHLATSTVRAFLVKVADWVRFRMLADLCLSLRNQRELETTSPRSKKFGDKILRQCYERAINECTEELVTVARRQNVSTPIVEKIKHVERGPFPEVTPISKVGMARKKILTTLHKTRKHTPAAP